MSLRNAFPFAALISATLITACGGGGGDNEAPAQVAPPAGPEGFYKGKTGTADFRAVVLDDGRTYAIYLTPDNGALGGVVIARGNASDGTYTSTVAKDFVVGEGVYSGSLTASYAAKKSFNGTFSAGGQTAPFTSTYNSAYDLYPYRFPSSLAGVYGIMLMASDGSTAMGHITITAEGVLSFSALDPSCSRTSGTVSPRSKGNVFDVTLTSTGFGCLLPGVALSGIVFYDAHVSTLNVVMHTDDLNTGILGLGSQGGDW